MPSRVLVDNGIREFFVREDVDYYHICENCEEYFETVIPLPHEEARYCGECYLVAVHIIKKWWKKITKSL